MAIPEKYGASGDAAHRHDAPVRLVAVDHPDRSSSFPVRPVPPVFLRVDHAHELPLIAMDELGKELARFSRLADLAHYLKLPGAPATLPFPIVREARREDGDQLSFAIGEGQGERQGLQQSEGPSRGRPRPLSRAAQNESRCP